MSVILTETGPAASLPKLVAGDGVFKSRMHYQDHEDKMYHEVTQPQEDLILERNLSLRNDPNTLSRLGSKLKGGVWGQQVASIPFITLNLAIKQGYKLYSKNKDLRRMEWNRFLRSDLCKPSLVVPNILTKR